MSYTYIYCSVGQNHFMDFCDIFTCTDLNWPSRRFSVICTCAITRKDKKKKTLFISIKSMVLFLCLIEKKKSFFSIMSTANSLFFLFLEECLMLHVLKSCETLQKLLDPFRQIYFS